MVAYLKVGPQVRTYSDYLRATQKVEKEDSMELLRGPRTQTTNNPPKPWATSFFPMRKLKGQPAHPENTSCAFGTLEEEDVGSKEDEESDDPSRIKGVTK